jgi:pimeloyl-ACP methyl ester carboxylesterase
MSLDEMAEDYFDLVRQLIIQPAIWGGVPTIVAGGSEDIALPMSASQDIHNRMINSTLVEIPQCGHSSSIEQPERVSELLEQLISAVNR